MTYYRAVPGEAEDTYEFLVESGVLVPVERCEHGYDRGHIIGGKSSSPGADTWIMTRENGDPVWCPGAVIGEDSTP